MLNFKKALALIASTILLSSAYSCGQTESETEANDIAISTEDSTKADSDADKTKDKDSDPKQTATQATVNKNDSDIEEKTEKPETTTKASSKEDAEQDDSENEEDEVLDESGEENYEEQEDQGEYEEPDEPDQGNSSSGSNSGGNSSGNSSGSNSSSSSSSSGNSSGSGSGSNSGSNSSSDSNSSSNSNSSSGSNSGGGSSSGGSSSGNNSGGNSSSSDTVETPTEAPTEAPTEPVKTYTAEVVLGASPQISGENVASDGSRIVITSGGEYLISGTVDDGQIEVATTEKVKLFLNGVSITNTTGPAIQVTDAKRFIIVLMEDTHSVLQDVSENTALDGVICSNDTVEIKGNGSVDIIAGNRHGISSDDDVVIENGTINITSRKTGIMANDDVTINRGDITINSGTNGIKSKGTLNINGGCTVISGGSKEEKSSIYAAGPFNYTGGYLFAAGNVVTPPTSSVNPFVIAGYSAAQPAGSTLSLLLNNTEMASLVPHNNYKCVMMLAPEIVAGDTFGLAVDGGIVGEWSVADGQNVFTIS